MSTWPDRLESYRAAGAVRLIAAPHPLRAGHVDLAVPEGLSLAEILRLAQPDPVLLRHAVVYLGDQKIAPALWPRVRPKAGAQVTIRVVPGFGGGGGGQKNVMRVVLSIAVIAAAVYLGPAVAGTLVSGELGAGGALWIGGTVIAGSTVSTVATAALGLGGLLALNALVPAQQPKSAASATGGRPTYLIGARNRARLYEPVRMVYGRVRVAPDIGALPYTEVVGDSNRLRLLYIWSLGEVAFETESFKIGETVLDDFHDFEIENLPGSPTDPPVTLYSNQVSEQSLALRIKQADGWVSRTTATKADEISIDIGFPAGLMFISGSTGDREALDVVFEIEFSPAGAGTWSKIPIADITLMTFSEGFVTDDGSGNIDFITFKYKRQQAIRVGLAWNAPSQGQYDVRLQRLTTDRQDAPSKHTRLDESWWFALRRITHASPISYPGALAQTALAILGTEQLNGVLDEFTGIVETVCLDWDSGSSSWVKRATNNPASLFRQALQGPAHGDPVADSRIDLVGLQDWHEFCVANGFAYNAEHASHEDLRSVLVKICRAGRAALDLPDGKWGVIIDQAQALAVTAVTPRVCQGFSFERAFVDPPHAWRIPFANELEDFRPDERVVYRDGYDGTNATKFEQIELPGVTHPDQVWKLGRYLIATAINQPETWSFNQDILEAFIAPRGRRILLAHDVLLIGLSSGRIKAVQIDGGGDVIGLTLDEAAPMEAGKTYGIAVRTVDDVNIETGVVTDPGEPTTISLETPIPAAKGVAGGELFSFGETGEVTEDALVTRFAPAGGDLVRLTAVPYRDTNYTADQGPIPPYVTKITPLTPTPAPTILKIRSDESVLGVLQGDQLRVRAAIRVAPVDIQGARLMAAGRPSETGEPFAILPVEERLDAEIIVSGVRQGESWDFEVWWHIEGLLLPGPRTPSYNNLIVGKSTPPAGLSGLTISVFGGSALLRWDEPVDLDVRIGGTVRFRHSGDFTGATWSASTSIGQAVNARALSAVLPLKPGTYLARVFDIDGNPAEDIAQTTTKQASVLAFAAVDTLDEAPSFAGIHMETIVSGGVLQLASTGAIIPSALDTEQKRLAGLGFGDDLGQVLPPPDGALDAGDRGILLGLFDPTSAGASGNTVEPEGTYDFAAGFDLVTVKRVRLTTRITAVSALVNDTLDDRTAAIDEWEDFDGGSSEADLTVWVRTTDEDPAGGGGSAFATEAGRLAGMAFGDDLGIQTLPEPDGSLDAGDRAQLLGLVASDPAGPPTWSAWQRLDSAEFEARGFEFQARLMTRDPSVNIFVSELGVDVEELSP